MLKKNLYIISEQFPYTKGFVEQFFETEIWELSKCFEKIYLFPLALEGEKRNIPENVIVNLSLANASRQIGKTEYLKNILSITSVFALELLKSNKVFFILKNLRPLINSYLQCEKLSELFYKRVNFSHENYFYSFWMNDGALILSILKKKNKLSSFIFRVNGFDLFDDRWPSNYIPFQYFNFKQTKSIVVLSQAGVDYLKPKGIFSEKLFLNYYGIYDKGLNQLNEQHIFTMVSCSSVIRLKRIDKIIDSLSLISFPVKWIHFGDGELMNEMRQRAKQLPKHIQVEFKGNVSNKDVISAYQQQSINLFIHTSETEGLGMAIIEAQSFGIPALAVGVGGVLNIVNEETGELLKPDDTAYEIAEKITVFREGEKNSEKFRMNVKARWNDKFNAVKNYKELYNKIIEKP